MRTKHKIDEARLQQFAVAYVPAVLAVVHAVQPVLGGELPEEFAVGATLRMVEAIRRAGVRSIAGYYLNSTGGALRRTCEALQIEDSLEALEDFIGGRL